MMRYAYSGTRLLKTVPNTTLDGELDILDPDAPHLQVLTTVADAEQAHWITRMLNQMHRELPLWENAVQARDTATPARPGPRAVGSGDDGPSDVDLLLTIGDGQPTRVRVALTRLVDDMLAPYRDAPLVRARVDLDGVGGTRIDMAVNAWLAHAGPAAATDLLDRDGTASTDGGPTGAYLPDEIEFYADGALADLVTIVEFGLTHPEGGYVEAVMTVDVDDLDTWIEHQHNQQTDASGTAR